MAQLATGEKYLKADRIIHRALIQHYDLYIKETRNGRDHFSLFHRKGSTPARAFPEHLYIRESDILQATTESASSTSLPTGRVAARMITWDYESDILSNSELDTREKVELTVHCSCQVMKDMFARSSLSEDDFDTVRQIGYSFMCFTDLILRENEAVELLIRRLMDCSRSEFTHAVNVSLYSGMLACELNSLDMLRIDNQVLKNLYTGTLLHDIGKTRIKPEIWQQPGKLSRTEYEVVKKHPLYSAQLSESANLPKEAKDVILYHHERWNGGGYPFNLSFHSIPPLARVAAICDVFDALTTRRNYRPARKPFESLTLMKRNMTGSFYVLYLDTFIQFLGRGSAY